LRYRWWINILLRLLDRFRKAQESRGDGMKERIMTEEGTAASLGIHTVHEMTECSSQKHFEFSKIFLLETMKID
jgi:hypothetical protein